MPNLQQPASANIPNTYLRQFFRYLGSDPMLLQGTQQTPESLAQLDGNNSFEDYCQFFINAKSVMQEPAIGLVLGQINQLTNMHGPLSLAAFQSTNIRDCLEIFQRFAPLRSAAFKFKWYEDGDSIGLELPMQEDTGEAHIPIHEAVLLALTNLITEVSQHRITPWRIELDYPRPAYAERYPEAFGITAFRFSCPNIRLLILREDSLLSLDTEADPALRASIIQRCEELLHGIQKDKTIVDRLRQIFTDNPGNLWSLQEMATHLNTSASTLQRRLHNEGTSYRQLHDDWLKAEACKLLGEPNLSVESIAILLGYSDVRAFRNACQRWFTMPPGQYRQNLYSIK